MQHTRAQARVEYVHLFLHAGAPVGGRWGGGGVGGGCVTRVLYALPAAALLLQALSDKKADILCDINQERTRAASKLGASRERERESVCVCVYVCVCRRTKQRAQARALLLWLGVVGRARAHDA